MNVLLGAHKSLSISTILFSPAVRFGKELAMASSTLISTLSCPTSYSSPNPSFCQKSNFRLSSSLPLLLITICPKPFTTKSKPCLGFSRTNPGVAVQAQTLEFPGSFFGGGFGSEGDPPSSAVPGLTALEDKEEPQCPPGLRSYETMAVLRPDMSEDDRLTFTQKYEELLVAGGGMYIEVFNRGVIPLAYSIKKKNKAGETNTYLDGIYLLFTYFTKPESIGILEETMKADDSVIRSMTFKIKKRKY